MANGCVKTFALPLLFTVLSCATLAATPRVSTSASAEMDRAVANAVRVVGARGLVMREPLKIVVHDDVDAFVRATGQTVPTLRAWAGRNRIDFLAPWMWMHTDVNARVTHEVCHAALYQQMTDAAARAIPRSVEEGLCSVLAGQANVRATWSSIIDDAPIFDVFADDAFVSSPTVAYGAAHELMQRAIAAGMTVEELVAALAQQTVPARVIAARDELQRMLEDGRRVGHDVRHQEDAEDVPLVGVDGDANVDVER
jgi:hypothetical protein